MEPLNDRELSKLLQKWEAPDAPAKLRSPYGRPQQTAWRWLWSGRIHVPVPVGALIILIAAALWLHSHTGRTAAPRTESVGDNAITRPVQSPIPAVPVPSPAPVVEPRSPAPASAQADSASL